MHFQHYQAAATFAIQGSTPPFLASPDSPSQYTSFRFLNQEEYDASSDTIVSLQHASLPCPRLPVAGLTDRRRQRSTTNPMERRNSTGSSTSSGSLRRSVPGMKKLMPLKLQSSRLRPKTDLASWLKNTISYAKPLLGSPIFFESEAEPSEKQLEQNKIPWMWSQGGKLLHDLQPENYRETPIYSEPRSPILSRAYFSDEDICCKCPPPGSVCDELCIVSDYEEEDSIESPSQASFIESRELFHEIEESVEISPTSSTSSRLSDLSIKCQGELDVTNETARPKMLSIFELAPGFTAVDLSELHNDVPERRYEGSWMDMDSDHDSDRSSSLDSLNEELLDACATPLAPARATVIKVPGSPTMADGFTFQNERPRPRRPSTPFRSKRRRLPSLDVDLPSTPDIAGLEDGAFRPRGRLRRSRSHLPQLNHDSSLPSPPATPSESPESSLSSEPRITIPVEQCVRSTFSNDIGSTADIIEAICKVLTVFPQDMLFLDTPCILSIRKIALSENAARFPQLSICHNPAVEQISAPRRNRLRRSKSKASSLFSSTRQNASIQTQKSSQLISDNNSLHDSLDDGDIISLPPPNLHPLRAIFPSSDDWWRSVLYAHLLAYNFVRAAAAPKGIFRGSEVHAQPGKFNVPSKASRTLGLPPALSQHPPRSGHVSLEFEIILEQAEQNLEASVARVVECMGTEEQKVEGQFVRALGEVVRGCEGNG